MLIDADLASNNGGWQWSAGTGTDPQPYFRIFNPYNQSEKVSCCFRFVKDSAMNGDQSRLTLPEITFENSFQSLAVCGVQVGEHTSTETSQSSGSFRSLQTLSQGRAEIGVSITFN